MFNRRIVLLDLLAALLLLAAVRFARADVAKDLTKIPIADSPSYAKVALVIGVSDYQFVRKLNASTRDAQAFYDLLVHQFKFDPLSITFLTDEPGTAEKQRPTYAYLKHAVSTFLQRVDTNSEVVFFYSGHGIRTGDEDYLVPLDADPQDIAGSCISYDKLKRQLETKTPRRALLITDACRSLNQAKGDTGTGFGQGGVSDLPQIAELVSCQPTQVSWEGTDFQQGVFTHYLLAGLKGDPEASTVDGMVTFDSLQQFVRGKVKAYTAAHFGSVQEPIGRTTLGSMVLARGQGEVVVVDPLAHIHVTSNPPGAKVYVDGQVVGTTPCTLDQDLGHLKTKQAEVTVEAQGFRSVVRTVGMERGATADIDCPLERIPVIPNAPVAAHLSVVTNPPGARVFAGNQEIAGKVTPCVIDFNMSAQIRWQGVVTVVLGDLRASQEVVVERDRTTALNMVLQRGFVGATRINPKDGAEMVYVPAGEFLMGSTEAEIEAAFAYHRDRKTGYGKAWFTCEGPQRRVYLAAYRIYKNDVTVAQYRKFCQGTGRQMPHAPDWGWNDNHPMTNVTWHDAKAYCEWAGARLPTEAQWEKAARGIDGRMYPWGNEWDRGKLWCSVGGQSSGTAPVGSFPAGASPYGCLDMAGNAWQWCEDWYDASYYRKGENYNPLGPVTGQSRVLRGGAWNGNNPPNFRVVDRVGSDPAHPSFDDGFRCVVRADS